MGFSLSSPLSASRITLPRLVERHQSTRWCGTEALDKHHMSINGFQSKMSIYQWTRVQISLRRIWLQRLMAQLIWVIKFGIWKWRERDVNWLRLPANVPIRVASDLCGLTVSHIVRVNRWTTAPFSFSLGIIDEFRSVLIWSHTAYADITSAHVTYSFRLRTRRSIWFDLAELH